MGITKSSDDHRICILIVDDDRNFREVLAFSFEAAGYRVLTAKSGNEAFDIVCSESVGIVISDVRMPDGDGFELLRKCKARAPQTPMILLVTGYGEITTDDASREGAEALFSKPFDIKELKIAVERLLKSPRASAIRRTDRIDVQLAVTLHFNCEKTVAIAASTLNISPGGMFVALEGPGFPNVNESFTFSLVVNGTRNFTGSGIVRWIRTKPDSEIPSGCGLEFIAADKDEMKEIIQSIRTQSAT